MCSKAVSLEFYLIDVLRCSIIRKKVEVINRSGVAFRFGLQNGMSGLISAPARPK